MEDIQFRDESELRKCTAVVLREVARTIGVTDANLEEAGEASRGLLRLVQQVFDESPPDELNKVFLKCLPIVPDDISQKLMSILMQKAPANQQETVEKKESGDVAELLKVLGLESKSSAFRREFRIAGNIGSSTGCITYISLCSQIQEGRKKGYSDDDITMAVKKAVTPGSELRTILDVKTDMPLPTVLNFIRSFMKEKSATELCRDLSEIVQKENESPQTFVLRAMELREKISLAPVHEGTVQYARSQVQDMFIHAIRTGLSNANVRAKLDTALRRGVDDEALLMDINAAATEEFERDKKQNGGAKKKITSAGAAVSDSNVNELIGNTNSLK